MPETYHFIGISVVLLVLYLITHILSTKKMISVSYHRRIWNMFLTLTFLVSASLGILLVLRINYGWVYNIPFNMLFWHVEASIAMAVISIFHIIWHWPYYKKIFSFS